MTDDEAAAKMASLPINCTDGHYDGDEILCELLIELGYMKVELVAV